MNVMERRSPDIPASLFEMVVSLAAFRRPMGVAEVMVFPTSYGRIGYYVCPRCRNTIEREFMSFCDRCGQRLGWEDYKNVKIVYPGRGSALHG